MTTFAGRHTTLTVNSGLVTSNAIFLTLILKLMVLGKLVSTVTS
jgi:hypothetical protein